MAPNTEMSGILIAPTRTAPDEFDSLPIEGGAAINFYALLPVHESEMELKLEHGAEQLLEILFEGGVGEVVMPERPNMVEALISGMVTDDLEKVLPQMRANLGPAPRSFGLLAKGSVRMKPPGWMKATGDKRFLEIYANQDALLERGEIVWAHIIQANSELFGRGADDCPAAVLYSFDPKANELVVELGSCASGLFELKGKVPDDPELQQFADSLEDEETVTSLRIPIPAQATFDIQCHFAAIMVCRKHLPGRCLKGGLFPLLVLPKETKAAMILPGKYWPKEFIDDFWTV